MFEINYVFSAPVCNLTVAVVMPDIGLERVEGPFALIDLGLIVISLFVDILLVLT